MNDGLPVSLAELLQVWGREVKANTFTGVPAKVLTYDPLLNVINAEIVVKNSVFDRSGEREYETYPQIPNVPVMWPRGGGKVVRLPLEPGDFVWLAFSQTALSEWRTTGQLSEPTDSRRVSIGYPYAIPGAFPDVQPLSPLDVVEILSGAMLIGEDGGDQIIIGGTVPGVRVGKLAVQPVALAPPVITAIAALATWCAALQAALLVGGLTPVVGAAMVTPTATLATAMALVAAAVPSTLTKTE